MTAYLFWLDVTNIPRSAASDAPFNVQRLKRRTFENNRSIPVVFKWPLFPLFAS